MVTTQTVVMTKTVVMTPADATTPAGVTVRDVVTTRATWECREKQVLEHAQVLQDACFAASAFCCLSSQFLLVSVSTPFLIKRAETAYVASLPEVSTCISCVHPAITGVVLCDKTEKGNARQQIDM